MKVSPIRTGFAVFSVLLVTIAAMAQEAPDWAKRGYDVSTSQVFAAALKSIQLQRHEVQSKNEAIFTVDFHVGTSLWSWGYNMRLVVTPIDDSHSKVTIGILRSGGKVFSWGSGEKEVRKILAGIDAELISAKTNAQLPTVRSAAIDPPSSLDVTSEPTGADVEVDGKFVGNTPTTLRLTPNEYTVTIKRVGYAPWTRTLTVIPGSELRIKAELEKVQQ